MIAEQIKEAGVTDPQNLEQQAISLAGTTVYEKLVKGYTEKQWGRPCTELPAFIIKRLPVRYTYDNNYFNDPYQGIPVNGYNEIIDKLLDGIEVRTDVDYLANRAVYDALAEKVDMFASGSLALETDDKTDEVQTALHGATKDVESGEVLAYVGNVYDPADRTEGTSVDVIPAPRSSGSVLKPLLYAAMLDNGTALPAMLFPDVPTYYRDFTPQNYNRTFDGAVPADRVVERSLNVPSVRMLDKYGRENFLSLVRGLGFRTIDRSADHYGLSLILGGAEITGAVLENARESGEYLMSELKALAEESGAISQVRGMGLMCGVEFSEPVAKEIGQKLTEKSILVGVVGDRVLRIVPPLIVQKSDIDILIKSIKEVL